MTVLRCLARTVAAAATAGLCLAPPSAAAADDYPPGEYRLEIYEVQIEVSESIDPGELCAEIYGTITIDDGRVAGGYSFFRATREEAEEVCEEDRPIDEGQTFGRLGASKGGITQIVSTFTGNQTKDHPFVFKVDLWDRDPIGDDQQIMRKSVSVWPPRKGVMPDSVSNARPGSVDSTVYFRYDIKSVTEEKEQERSRGQGDSLGDCLDEGFTYEECREAEQQPK